MGSKRSKIIFFFSFTLKKKKETETSNITTVITALTRTKEALQKMQYKKKKIHLGIAVARPLFRILSTKCSFLPPPNYFPIPIHHLPFPTSKNISCHAQRGNVVDMI